MAQVSVGQVENLEDLVRGLNTVRDALESACREQVATAEGTCAEVQEETKNSESMLKRACRAEQEAQQAVEEAQQNLQSAEEALSGAESALLACEAQSSDEQGRRPSCSGEQVAVANAQVAVAQAQAALTQATEDRQRMEQRVEYVKKATAMAEEALERAQQECRSREKAVCDVIETGTARLTAAHQALEVYLSTNPHASQFGSWLHWNPDLGKPITPDVIRDRMSLSVEQQRLVQEYLYDRNPAYHALVDKWRGEWSTAKGDVERNMVNRNVRIHLSGEFAEQIARHALAPLGGETKTQGRTFVGDAGRYTKTDLLVTDLRVPVILGRGDGMGAPVGGSMAFEVKCGKSNYLYAQKEHMIFQAEGHKQADAHCTLCSRDIYDLPHDKEKELRDALRTAGSPMVGMLPTKNDIDHSCLEFVQCGANEEKK